MLQGDSYLECLHELHASSLQASIYTPYSELLLRNFQLEVPVIHKPFPGYIYIYMYIYIYIYIYM